LPKAFLARDDSSVNCVVIAAERNARVTVERQRQDGGDERQAQALSHRAACELGLINEQDVDTGRANRLRRLA
jgi:hypothetical protein